MIETHSGRQGETDRPATLVGDATVRPGVEPEPNHHLLNRAAAVIADSEGLCRNAAQNRDRLVHGYAEVRTIAQEFFDMARKAEILIASLYSAPVGTGKAGPGVGDGTLRVRTLPSDPP